jgi:pyruvate dehydrogenase E2 component (dihydrolipoamide acetyltransferase)
MSAEIKLPVLGENVDSATVLRIMVKPGDTVSKDQAIMELETEKAAMDLPASEAGVVKEILVKEGDTVKVGQTILTLNGSGEKAEKKEEPAPQKQEPPKEAPKAETQAKTSPEPKPKPEPEPEPKAEADEKQPPAPTAPEPSPAAPGLRRKARELGVDISEVQGSGPEGRITEDDIRSHARSIILNASAPTARWGDTERVPLSAIRSKIAEHVEDAWTSIPHVTQFDNADITEVDKLRKSRKLSLTAIAMKIVSGALKTFPQFNASLDMENDDIILKKYVHIGIAVDTEHGLLVPVIRDVDKKGIVELSAELAETAEKARNRKLAVDDMQGSSFTITNLGSIGGSHFTPIINSPDVAILGISRASQQPAFIEGQFQPRLLLPLSLSYDHRAVDGADGARFLRWIVQAFENPLMMAL